MLQSLMVSNQILSPLSVNSSHRRHTLRSTIELNNCKLWKLSVVIVTNSIVRNIKEAFISLVFRLQLYIDEKVVLMFSTEIQPQVFNRLFLYQECCHL